MGGYMSTQQVGGAGELVTGTDTIAEDLLAQLPPTATTTAEAASTLSGKPKEATSGSVHDANTASTSTKTAESSKVQLSKEEAAKLEQVRVWRRCLRTITKDLLIATSTVAAEFEFEADSKVDYTRFVLYLRPELDVWRTELVPNTLSERDFWRNLFYLLQQMLEKSVSRSGNASSLPTTSSSTSTSVAASSSEAEAEALRGRVQQLEAEVASLKQQLSQAKAAASSAKLVQCVGCQCITTSNEVDATSPASLTSASSPSSSSSSTSSSQTTSTPCRGHAGMWTLDKNALEFLELAPELKANLRAEKAKRLAVVYDQLKWVCDDDRPESMTGYWSCCKVTTHAGSGCANVPHRWEDYVQKPLGCNRTPAAPPSSTSSPISPSSAQVQGQG